MTRKSVKFPSGFRRGQWKTSLMKRECGDKIAPVSILVSTSCAKRWSSLKSKFHFRSDSELVEYLLTLGEAQPGPSTSPEHESDDGWCTTSLNGRKKRGPSLRAVLRRSTRNTGSRSDFLPESVESENFHIEDSLYLEDTERSRKFSGSCSRSTKFSDYNDLLSKKRYDATSGPKKDLNSDEEAKASQLDAELALLVESVALQPQDRNENELYEFQDDQEAGKCLSPHSSLKTENSNNIAKTSHKRWKSYHKDKRKWKQSYAAVMPDDENEDVQKVRTKTKEESSTSTSEKERKIFKTLKKNRILTAYLDSLNKIAANTMKDSTCPSKEDVEVPVKEEDEKPDIQEPSLSFHKKSDKVDVDCGTNKGKEDVTELQVPEKGEDVLSGKENQSKTVSSEPVFIEVGERVKLKKRKKKLIPDPDDLSLSSKEDDSVNLNGSNTTDLEAHHHKQKRNWKKSIINYELEEMEQQKRKKATTDSTLNSSNIPCYALTNESELSLTENHSELKLSRNDLPQVENADVLHSDMPEFQENNRQEQENHHNKTNNCSLCNIRHHQQPCPVRSPHHVVKDSISFEQWQLQCQVQVRCSVIEAPRPKSGRLRRSIPGSAISTDVERKNRDTSTGKSEIENTRYFAEESLPVGVGLKVISEDHGKGVVAQSLIVQYTQFGPLVGPRISEKDISDESDMRHIWEVLDGKQAIYINTEDPQKSNWLRFMRPAPEREERNITLMVQNKQLYFVSIKDIPKGDELLYWADDHITLWSKKKILKSSCGGCNMRFAHPLYYRTHCAVFHDPSHSLTIRKYHCKICGEAVMGKENIMKHAADLHEGRGAYQCQYCHKFFLRLNYLEMHRTYGCSSNPHRTRPLCDFCGRYFCQPQKLKVHIKRMHSDMNEVLKEFQCKSCLKLLGSRAALQRHFKEVHHRDVVMTSNCDRCGKSFQNRSNLKIHMLTHSGVKPFRCQQENCSAAFTTKQCLQLHYKKAHGLSEDSLPRIERSIAYTFDAYAGETLDGSKSDDQVKKPQRILRKGRKSSAKSQRSRSHQIQSVEIEHQQEPDEPLPPLEHGTGPFETSGLPECSEPPEVNDVAELHSFSTAVIPTTVSESLMSQKYTESEDASHENSLPPPEIIGLSYGEDEKQLPSDKTLTPLRTVTLRQLPEESYHTQHIAPMMNCHSPTNSPLSPRGISPNQDLHSMINLESKGHKKWLGEVLEVAEEAAAAAMRLSPRLSPHMKRDLYDFDEHKGKSKLQYVDNPVRQDLQIEVAMVRNKTASALAPFHPPESASMLVEAALDAAERDICCPSLMSKTSPNISSNSPEPLHLPHPSYCQVRSPSCGDISSPSYYVPNVASPDPGISQYSLTHSPSPHSHIHPLDTYSVNPQHMIPSRLYNVHHHQQHQHQILPAGPPSSDDEGGVDSDCNARGECAQNLSLNVKDKTSFRSNISTMYPDLNIRSSVYQDHVPLPQQNDLNFSGAMVVSSPRYHLYDLSPDRERSDISVTDLTVCNRNSSHDYSSYNEEIGGSVDLTLPRSHSTSNGHIILASSSINYNSNNVSPNLAHLSPSQHGHPGPAHQYVAPPSMPSYSSHPSPYQNSPLQRSHISSSSNSPSASPSPGPAHYNSYPPYY